MTSSTKFPASPAPWRTSSRPDTGSLAHVIAPGQAVSRTPAGYQDTEPLAGYLAALADPQAPPAACKWLSPHEAEITASLEPGQLISVQVTYAPGWRARWNGASCPIRRDGLGLMLTATDWA